jgi:hypothetical protein
MISQTMAHKPAVRTVRSRWRMWFGFSRTSNRWVLQMGHRPEALVSIDLTIAQITSFVSEEDRLRCPMRRMK